jgi:argininosuccinate synthase
VPALRAGALANAERATAADLARPLLARQLVDVARLERAAAVAHACTGADREVLEARLRALDPALQILAPADTWSLSAADKIARLREHGIADPGADGDAGLPLEAPDTPATVDIAFERGVPVEISGVPMSVAELVQCLDTIAGGHGVGRTRGHGVPALVVLHAAHQALENTAGAGGSASGLARVELFNGDCRVIGRHAMA